VVRVPVYRSRGPGSFRGATRFFWEVVGLERVHLASWMQLRSCLKEKNSGSGLGDWDYGCRDPSCWPRDTLYPQKLALTSPTVGGRSVGIVRLRTKATEFSFLVYTDIMFHIIYRLIFKLHKVSEAGCASIIKVKRGYCCYSTEWVLQYNCYGLLWQLSAFCMVEQLFLLQWVSPVLLW
jgi:hypothetical protein